MAVTRARRITQWLKTIALVLLLIPAANIGVISVAEMVEGRISGLLELLLVVPLVVLAVVGWRRPRLGGQILLAAGIVVALVYAVWMWGRADSLPVFLLLLLLVPIPPIVAGILFLMASRYEPRPGETSA